MSNRIFFKSLASFLLAGFFVLNAPAAVRGADRYYMMVFASEATPNLPRLSHSFAAFIKVQEQETGSIATWPVEIHTISWMPATLDVHLLRAPESGVNLSLPASLNLAASNGTPVFAWGPFEIQRGLYERARAQITRLNSGEVSYKVLDTRFRPNQATNCIHAISDIAAGPLLNTGTAHGVGASQMVVNHLTPWIVEPTKTHNEILQRLGLSGHSIRYLNDAPILTR